MEDLLRTQEKMKRKNPQNEPHYEKDRNGIQVMRKLQRLVHHSVLGMGSVKASRDSEVVGDYIVPRFLHYRSSGARTARECIHNWDSVTVDQLIPDGLHVDTNNNKHFRHW